MKMLMIILVLIMSNPSFAEEIRCHGTEPFWGATIKKEKLVFRGIPNTKVTPITGVSGASGYNASFLQLFSNESGPVAVVIARTCSDSMSDFDFPQQVVIFDGENTYYGCCGKGVVTGPGY